MKPKKPKPKKASKTPTVKSYLTTEVHKKFMKKVEEQGMHGSQWIRHQIMKWVK